jgi:hypothetical protein
MWIKAIKGAGIGVLLATLLGTGCDLPCKTDSDCFGTTPVCDTLKGACTSACKGPQDCAPGWICNDQQFCSPQ